jgi:hypothetical protein
MLPHHAGPSCADVICGLCSWSPCAQTRIMRTLRMHRIAQGACMYVRARCGAYGAQCAVACFGLSSHVTARVCLYLCFLCDGACMHACAHLRACSQVLVCACACFPPRDRFLRECRYVHVPGTKQQSLCLPGVCRCASMWMWGYAAVRACGYAAIRLCGYAAMRYVSVRACECACT